MKKIIIIVFLSLHFLIANSQSIFFTGGNICPTESWKLVFFDEFDGNSIDQSKWFTCNMECGTPDCEWARTHGDEGQIYLDENVIESNGYLKLKTYYAPGSQWYSAIRNYTSGYIESMIQNFHYGKFEIKCKIPNGRGFWPAFWTYGGDEIDIFEFACQESNVATNNIHKNGDDDLMHFYYPSDFYIQDHIYRLEWDPFYLRWYIDNQLIRTMSHYYTENGNQTTSCFLASGMYIDNPLFPTSPTKVIANLAIGNESGDETYFKNDPNEETIFPNSLDIDYIRVYQRTPQEGLTDLCASMYINGSNKVTNITSRYDFMGPIEGEVIWTVSDNLKIMSQSSTTINVQASIDDNCLESNIAWITVTTPALRILSSYFIYKRDSDRN